MLSKKRVNTMHADYMSGMTLVAVGRKYNRDRRSIREIFEKRKLYIRPMKYAIKRLPNGRIAPAKEFTEKELDAMIAKARKVIVPVELRLKWRKWSLPKRADFIARLRAKINPKRARPELPFSDNVEPFEYGSENARAIAKRMNAGTDSRTARVKIDLASQGVIWKGKLFFWSPKVGYESGPYTKENGRALLHHLIWEDANGRKVPSKSVIRFADSNTNNLGPHNLVLQSRNDLARENQAKGNVAKSREEINALLARTKRTGNAKNNGKIINDIFNRR